MACSNGDLEKIETKLYGDLQGGAQNPQGGADAPPPTLPLKKNPAIRKRESLFPKVLNYQVITIIININQP